MILALLLAASGSDVRICDKTSAVQCMSVSAAGGITVAGSGTFDISDRVGRALGIVTIGAGSAVIGHVINDAGTAVIGHVIADTGSTTAVTGNVTVVQPTGTNLHAVLDTTSTTACTQATGTNLHAVLDTTSTTAVTQATGTNLHAVLDTTSTTAVTQATAANLNATVVLAAGTALAGKVGIDQTTLGTTNGVVPVGTTVAAAAVASQKMVAVNTTTNVKASAGNVYGLSCANANASICWVQFYNTAGSPTCGTAVIWAVAMPSSGTVTIPPGALALANHATGIAMCMGTTATGATACTTANACTIFYQ